MDLNRVSIGGFVVSVTSSVHESLRCLLCSMILENPHQTPCGCRFCLGCITVYLQDEAIKVCPGKSEDCVGVDLMIERDLRSDLLAKRDISKLICKCCLHSCYEECEISYMKEHLSKCSGSLLLCGVCKEDVVRDEFLEHTTNLCYEGEDCCDFCNKTMKRRTMKEEHHNYEHENTCLKYIDYCPNECGESGKVVWVDHRRVCPLGGVSCPYKVIGCSSTGATFPNMPQHMQDSAFKHSEILLKHIGNINNEIACINNAMATIAKDISKLTIQSEDRHSILNSTIGEMKQDNVDKMGELRNEIQREVSSQVETIHTGETIAYDKIYAKMFKMKAETERMRNKFDAVLQKQIEYLSSDNFLIRKELQEIKEYVAVLKGSPNRKDPVITYIVKNIWRMHKVISPPFYTHPLGYKMELLVANKVSGYLSIYACLKSGEYDDTLAWPFRRSITIRIMDMEEGGRDYEKTIHFDEKAGDICNRKYLNSAGDYGCIEFISYHELYQRSFLLKDNQLQIQCFTEELANTE